MSFDAPAQPLGFEERLLQGLLAARSARRQRSRRLREGSEGSEIRVEGRTYLNFSSNNYLGLAGHHRIREALQRGVARYGVGSGGSHLIAGYGTAHARLEEELAAFLGRPRSLLFSSGYMANLGVLSTLARRCDTVLQDRANHASLIDAAVLSRARLRRYPHLDLSALEALLVVSTPGVSYVVTDAVFSMSGDLASLRQIASVCRDFGATLVVDDAHGFGVLGPEGRGTVRHFGLGLADVPVLIGTLGKALGVFGAFVAGSEALIETLIQRARSYIYTTAPPPALAEAVRAALAVSLEESWRREHLFALIAYFKAAARDCGLPLLESCTPIQPIMIGNSAEALRAAELLQTKGIYLVAIRPPTVPKGSARLRISLTADHTRAQVDQLLDALCALGLSKRACAQPIG